MSVNGNQVTVTPTDEMGRTFDVQTYTFGSPAPGVPTGLTPTPGNNQVGLSWTAPSGTVSSYNVKRGTVSGGPYTTISTLGAVTSPAYLDLTAVNGTLYYYVVSALNGGGESLDSAPAAATPSRPPPGCRPA